MFRLHYASRLDAIIQSPTLALYMDVPKDPSGGLPLFRAEAVASLGKRSDSPLDALGFGWRFTAIIYLILAVVLVAIAGWAKFPRKERAQGDVIGAVGMKRVASSRAGVISKFHIRQGDIVEKGQDLLTISYDRNVDGASVIASSLNAAREQLEFRIKSLEDNAAVLEQKASDIDSEVRSMQDQIRLVQELAALKREQISDRERTVAAMETLRDQRIVSDIQYRATRNELLEQQQQLILLRRERSQLLAKLSESASAKRQLERQTSASRATIRAESAAFEEKAIALRAESEETLVAPVDGLVSSQIVTNGEVVKPGASLLIITSPDQQLIGRAWVKSSAIGFLRVGSEARLKIAAFPHRKFGPLIGTVKEIATAPTPIEDLPHDLKATEAMYSVRIALPPAEDAGESNLDVSLLSNGMKFDVELIMERRTLLEMLFDPARAALSGLE